jgi:DNA polymerase III subunit gamma/tau
MQAYQVSARKYRPPRFEELVGQDHITTTLRNAIAKGQLAQAYLFCGPRGVGKTSCARILAKTINCPSRDHNQEACGTCPSCESFDQGRSLAIHELDAASNNSVDDIRSLVEQVRYPPQGSDFKVYIIDEVHMLSTAAFNALLKTLEEPPPYAKFILATTEKHKILPTILSRCQVFDFKRIRLQDIADRLALVCQAEGIQFDHDALLTIASRSDGALRDALTMLDQLAGFSGGVLTNALVCDQLGVLDRALFVDCLKTMLQGEPAMTLLALEDLIARGYDPMIWVLGMASHFRNVLMAKTEGTIQLLDSGIEYRKQLIEQSKNTGTDMLLAGLHLLSQVELQYKQSRQPRILVETAVLKICYIAHRNQKKTLVEKSISPNSLGTEHPTTKGHPLEGITSKLPVADLKTPAKIKIHPQVPTETVLHPKIEVRRNTEIDQKPLFSASGPMQHSPLPESGSEHPISVQASTPKVPPYTATTVDFLQKIRGHLGKSLDSPLSQTGESGHPWSPPPPSVGHNLETLWKHLVQECRTHNLGSMEGILTRNQPSLGSQGAPKEQDPTTTEQTASPAEHTLHASSVPIHLPVFLFSDTEKTIFDREKQGILDFLLKYGTFETRPHWVIHQHDSNSPRANFLTEAQRFARLSAENDNFKDFSARFKLFLI